MRTILLETSIAVRLFVPDDPRSAPVRSTLERLILEGSRFVIAPQVLYELRAVLTRPGSDNGYGQSPARFEESAEALLALAELLPDPADLVDRWRILCRTQGTLGKQSHDARLVAWMEAHQVASVLTLNPRHFLPFAYLSVLTP